jgi:integrase
VIVTSTELWNLTVFLNVFENPYCRQRNPLHRTLVLTCAATALRASEILALRWSDTL